MTIRDAAEAVLRNWHQYELARKGLAIIDYDCMPTEANVGEPITGRLDAYDRLSRLKSAARAATDIPLVERLTADVTFLEALLGAQHSLQEYVLRTQGCMARGWASDYIAGRAEEVRELLASRDISWGSKTMEDLEALEGHVSLPDARGAILAAAREFESCVRSYTGAQARPNIEVETVEIDDYWLYWLDGASQNVRLRLNLRRAKFTPVRARQFAIHELLGHALQYANISLQADSGFLPWFPLFSVHATYQVLFEGLAQTLPLFVAPEDDDLALRVRLDHYLQLVRAELHIALNAGSSIATCVEHAHRRVPWWRNEEIGDSLADRGTNSPLLRTYLWAYPAGCDWFINLAEKTTATFAQEIINAAYFQPLSVRELQERWKAGPPIGGEGGSICLR
jgi:hypothetical protein